MEDFHKLFYEEAGDLINSLEENLMLLEEDLSNTEIINEVFRIMHSLKGSGAMFGYNNLSSFTHELESLYDKVRSKTIPLTANIINFTINSTDHIKALLKGDDDEDIIKKSRLFLNQMELFSSKNETSPKSNEKITQQTEASKKPQLGKKLYFILFDPNPNILNDGTNPLYLLDELSDLGNAIIKTNYKDLPQLEDIDVDKCYFKWEIILSSTEDFNTIEDVFIFVQDDSLVEIELISEKDVFSVPDVEEKIRDLFLSNKQSVKGIKRLIKLYEADVVEYDQLDEDEIVIDSTETEETPLVIQEESVSTTTQTQENIIANPEFKIPETLKIDTVKVSSKKLDSLINLVSEFVTTQARLHNIASNNKSAELNALSEDFQLLSRQFRDVAFDMRLIPVHTMIIKFKRLIRDLSKSLGKKVQFITEGTETELDKNIISTLSDPIMHIIRNSIDHGIEKPETRIKSGKPETGTIKLKAEYSGAYILISIEDDGAGIDPEIIAKKAIEKKLIDDTTNLSMDEIYDLLLLPGFSTSEKVTDVSGRGVGMDVVKRNIDDLRGEVKISSEKGSGTKITIKLPLTLSIIDGLLVGVNNSKYILPLASVLKIYKVSNDEIEKAYKNIIDIEGVQYPFINLIEQFANSDNTESIKHFITVNYHDKIVGLIVNELYSEYQAVLKPIDKVLNHTEMFSGASILGDGKVAMVIDTNKLIHHFTN